jgi:bifunctional non-homologous end joining protein LigD
MRILARRDGAGVRLITRQGNDFTARFPLVVEAVAALPGRSFLLDGEAIVTNHRGLAVFDLIRRNGHGRDAVLCAFDLIEFDGEDLRRTPIERRKERLLRLVRDRHPGIVFNATLRCRWRHRVQERLRARLRGHCVEAAWLAFGLGDRRIG